MRLTLKPLNAVREEELGLISTPFMAVDELSSYFMRPERVDGLEYWWNHCIRQYNMSHPNYQHQSWEQLCKLIKQGELVLVHDKDRPPLSPACRQVNGQWVVESSADRLSFGLRHHLVSLKIERDERALRAQKQAVPASGPEGLPVEPVTSKRASLGPHVEGGQKDCIREPMYANLQSMDPEYFGEETGKVWGTKVRYLNETERQECKLTIKNGRLFDSTGKPFDTTEASSVFAGGKGKAIFVMDEYGDIYASKLQSVGKFHHSSFLSGKPVASAGEITVKNGYVEEITRRSGHYQPTQAQLSQFLSQLRTNGINLEQVNIQAGF